MNVLECYGVATVAEDKATDTDEVLVYLPSLYPEADGEVVATAEKKDVTIQSPTGDTTSSSGLSSNAVMMKWLLTLKKDLLGYFLIMERWDSSLLLRPVRQYQDGL